MRKSIFIILLLLFAISSCEKDNICIDDTTPFLVMGFNDFEDQDEFKALEIDSIQVDGYENYTTNQSIDSLSIPLDLNENFTLYKIWSEGLLDSVKVTYTRNDIFVGRSCGYKTIFEDFELESNTTNWIKGIEINNNIIDNDTIAAITIFH